jgi:hypothetical protein
VRNNEGSRPEQFAPIARPGENQKRATRARRRSVQHDAKRQQDVQSHGILVTPEKILSTFEIDLLELAKLYGAVVNKLTAEKKADRRIKRSI